MEGGGSVSQTSGSDQNRVQVPAWLQPFFDQAVGSAGGALSGLDAASNRDNFANLTPDQLAAMQGMRDMAGGAGGFLPTAQNTFMEAAGGVGTGFLDPALQERLSGAGFDMGNYIGEGRDAVGFTETPEAREALMATARGDNLYGGKAFDASVDAAVRAAQPHIMSAFGKTAGGVGSGLSRTAVGQSAIDAFAGQYDQERNRQMGAAGTLEAGGRADRGQYLGFGEAGANRARRGDEMLAGISDTERNRQMRAAEALPGIGMLDENMMMQVGQMLQGQQQGELDRSQQDQLQLLMASLQGLPLSDFFGSDRDYKQSTVEANASWGA